MPKRANVAPLHSDGREALGVRNVHAPRERLNLVSIENARILRRTRDEGLTAAVGVSTEGSNHKNRRLHDLSTVQGVRNQRLFVDPVGLEPTTNGLKARSSYQLS